jgi:hypothetical protein
MAFLALIVGQDDTHDVMVLHRILVLGLTGDMIPHQYLTVDAPNSTFHLTGNPVRVPTVATMSA